MKKITIIFIKINENDFKICFENDQQLEIFKSFVSNSIKDSKKRKFYNKNIIKLAKELTIDNMTKKCEELLKNNEELLKNNEELLNSTKKDIRSLIEILNKQLNIDIDKLAKENNIDLKF